MRSPRRWLWNWVKFHVLKESVGDWNRSAVAKVVVGEKGVTAGGRGP